jgi:hypothetical protein
MKKLSIVFVLVLMLSCSSEEKEATINAMDKEMIANDTNIHQIPAQSDPIKTQYDSLGQNQPILVDVDEKKKVSKNTYPKRAFSTNIGEKDSLYLAYEWSITFFVNNGQTKELQKFRKKGFPMEWWATGRCSYYPVHADSVGYFLNIARKMGYKEYGFDCEKVAVSDFDAALSNIIETRLKTEQNIDLIINDYKGLELVKEHNPLLYSLRTVNMNAKDLIKTVTLLNKDERIDKASFTFRWCE